MSDSSFNEKSFIDSIKSKIYIELPFTQQELTDDILNQALSGGLSDLNNFFPKFKTTFSYDGDSKNQQLVRSYTSMYDVTTIEPYIEEYGYGLAEIHTYTTQWTYKEIDNDPSASKYFKDLVKYRAGMYMANVRRSATMNNLPFDIKGDQFYQEIKEQYDSLKEKLSRTVSAY